MTVSRYRRELSEMMKIWNCGDRQAAQQFLHAVYITKGYRPETAASFTNHLSDEELSRCFVAVMDEFRKTPPFIDLLALQPVKF